MIQDKLIEGAVYWVKHYKDWLTIPCVYIAGDWIIGDDTLDSKHVTDWLLIPTPEEIREQRKFIDRLCGLIGSGKILPEDIEWAKGIIVKDAKGEG